MDFMVAKCGDFVLCKVLPQGTNTHLQSRIQSSVKYCASLLQVHIKARDQI